VTASNLAAEGVEVVKNIIDTNYAQGDAWNDGLGSDTYKLDYQTTGGLSDTDWDVPIMFDDTSGIYDYSSSADVTVYKRRVVISNFDVDGDPADEEMMVESIVEWTVDGDTESVNIEDHFFNWR